MRLRLARRSSLRETLIFPVTRSPWRMLAGRIRSDPGAKGRGARTRVRRGTTAQTIEARARSRRSERSDSSSGSLVERPLEVGGTITCPATFTVLVRDVLASAAPGMASSSTSAIAIRCDRACRFLSSSSRSISALSAGSPIVDSSSQGATRLVTRLLKAHRSLEIHQLPNDVPWAVVMTMRRGKLAHAQGYVTTSAALKVAGLSE